MTKKKSIITKLFVALVALTLISCCFLGSTFARYTSGGNGSATTNIAKWSITATESFGTTPVEFGDLSPAYDVGNRDADVTNSTGKINIIECIAHRCCCSLDHSFERERARTGVRRPI